MRPVGSVPPHGHGLLSQDARTSPVCRTGSVANRTEKQPPLVSAGTCWTGGEGGGRAGRVLPHCGLGDLG